MFFLVRACCLFVVWTSSRSHWNYNTNNLRELWRLGVNSIFINLLSSTFFCIVLNTLSWNDQIVTFQLNFFVLVVEPGSKIFNIIQLNRKGMNWASSMPLPSFTWMSKVQYVRSRWLDFFLPSFSIEFLTYVFMSYSWKCPSACENVWWFNKA